jgi:DNA-binding response OmpR family regulator
MQRILVIDDDPAVTGVLKRGLSYAGFVPDVASSGGDGLAAARERPPDLVILDVMMPGLDGFEVLRRLRAAEAHLPVLFLTAKDAPADEVKGLEAGADVYVVKPFTFEVLLAHVHAIQDFGRAGSGALIVERALARVPGVVRAYVNPATEMAWVQFDDARCQIGVLIAAVERAGFRVGVPIASKSCGVVRRRAARPG